MSSAENIHNAFHVVYKSYENIQKLIDYCKTIGLEKSNYINVVDKFLRYKSDNNLSGWFIHNFIMLFQDKNDAELDNGWRNGPIYVMEIELYNPESKLENIVDLPCIRLSKFEYDNLQKWESGCSPSNHWRFYYPLRRNDIMNIQENGDYLHITTRDQEASNRHYWGVKKITSKRIPLTDITANNVVEKVFGTFDNL
ncbi:hypothetical protein ABEP17_19615 [Priestia flexa]|uniref:hypothetical protein n=1 Tax=Priestia flexa TaxID=86664 RepID=UPI00248F474D|nr:hypothetical protein [Priestia flexa]